MRTEMERGATDAGKVPVTQEPSAPATIQTEGRQLIVHEGGKSDTIGTVLDLPMFGAWARATGLNEATLLGAWRKGERDGYPGRLASAAFRNGTLSVKGDVDEPDTAQIEAFEAEFKAASFPTIIPLTALGDLPPGIDSVNGPDIFVCHDFDGRVVMIHRRYENKDGTKGFLPWTYWSDGQWRQMEPETLPFFGLPGSSDHSTLFLHEGAGAARGVKRILANEDQAEFPWREEMRWGHHVGWIGGVHAAERSDWATLAAKDWKRVVIVADNDDGGIKAAAQIARHFPANVWLLAFDQRFVDGFDLADEWPADLFDKDGKYRGPPMSDFLIPATYATRTLPSEGRGRPVVVLRDEFAKLVAATNEPERIIFRHNPGRDYRPEQFNRIVAPVSGLSDTAAKVFKDGRCSYDRMIYRPGFRAGTLNDEGRCFNVFQPGRVAAVEGDAQPWFDYLEHLFPVAEDRDHVVRWLATLIAKPRIRMIYGLLLISGTQGVGKSTLHFILERLLGYRNVSAPNETMIVDSQFNSWLARKRLIFVHEFYSGQSRKAYDKLKSFVTEPSVEINEKGVPSYPMENWAHFIACSNSDAALHLDDNDRRWLVPMVTESLKPHAYWVDLRRWLEADGLGIVLSWAQRFVASGNFVEAGVHAPASARKQEIIDSSRSRGQEIAIEMGEALVALDRKVIVRTDDLHAFVALRRGFKRPNGEADLAHARLEKKDTLLRSIKSMAGLTIWANAKRPKFGTTKDSIIMNFTPADDDTWPMIKEHLIALSELDPGAPM